MTWPKEVPILTAGDIHREAYDGPNGTHCLRGWCIQTFGINERYRVENVLQELISPTKSVIVFNDDITRPRRTIARTWNRAMARLGYTEGNPETI